MNAYRMFPVCFLLLLGLAACAPNYSAPLRPGTEAPRSGVSTAVYPLPFETMWDETTTLLRDQGIAITGQLKEEGRGTLKGRTVEQQEVTAELLSHGANDTAVTTQVGPVADREAANVLQRAIARRAYNVIMSHAR